MSPEEQRAVIERCRGNGRGTLCSNHAIVCPMIVTVLGVESDEDDESSLVGAKDETGTSSSSSTTTAAAINVGCLIFAWTERLPTKG